MYTKSAQPFICILCSCVEHLVPQKRVLRLRLQDRRKKSGKCDFLDIPHSQLTLYVISYTLLVKFQRNITWKQITEKKRNKNRMNISTHRAACYVLLFFIQLLLLFDLYAIFLYVVRFFLVNQRHDTNTLNVRIMKCLVDEIPDFREFKPLRVSYV